MQKESHKIMADESGGLISLPRNRGMRIAFIVVSLLLAAGAVIPALIDLALNGRLTWSLYSLGAIVMAWLILAPWFLLPRNRALASWIAAVVTIPLFLRLVEFLAPAKGWLLPLGLPAAALGLAALGGMLGVWRNGRGKARWAIAWTFFILGILSFTEYLGARPYIPRSVSGLALAVIALCAGVASAALFLAAWSADRRRVPQ